MEQLLRFDRGRVRRQDCLISWKEIAFELGVSADTLQRWAGERGLRLPRWGGPRSPVYLPKGKMMVLRALFLG